MTYKYAYQGPAEGTARGVATDVPISTKTAVMVARYVRGKTTARALRDLQRILHQQDAIPFTRFSEGAGHKPGIGPGKYPVKATKAFITLIESVQANAADKGLGEELLIVSAVAHKAANQVRYGRHRGRERKNTHVEIVVKELEQKKEKPAKKATPATTKKPAENAPVKTPAEEQPTPKKETPKKESKPKKTAKKTPAKKTTEQETKKDTKENER